MFIRLFAAFCVSVLAVCTQVMAQNTGDTNPRAVLWKQVDIPGRDLFQGPGGSGLQPDMKGIVLIGRQPGGNNLKFRIRDGKGVEWVAKIADESQPEVAAVRLLWGIGYETETDYLVPRLELGKHGSFKNARLEARPKGTKRARWMWTDNPFVGSRELNGLKIMMAMLNNWDLKDDNNAILVTKDGEHYVVSDLGASFGRMARTSESRSGRSVNDPEGYSKSVFLNGTNGGQLNFAYTGSAEHLLRGIPVEHGRWLAGLLLQLSDKQILDAFRAANYKDTDAVMFAEAFKARIRALDEATRDATAGEGIN